MESVPNLLVDVYSPENPTCLSVVKYRADPTRTSSSLKHLLIDARSRGLASLIIFS